MKSKRLLLSTCAIIAFLSANAQLDTRHWVPPFFAKPGPGTGTTNIRDHFVALSTPAEETIPVTIRNGFGQLIDIIEISRDSPAEYLLGSGNANTQIFPLNVIPEDSLNIPIRSQGLTFTSFQPFFVNMRHKCGSQGTSLTTKGQVALGRRFYSGHLYTVYNNDPVWNLQRRSHFISVMATEDNTTVTFDMIKEPIFLIGYGPGEPVTVTLNALESFTVGVDHQFFNNETINLTNGIRITSDKDIAVNTGSWLAGNTSGQDIGSDQLVPAENVGQEYIVVRGLGNETTERPMVVATEDNTEVYLNGETTPAATLNEGEFYIIPTSQFTPEDNMYILTTEKAYMYQTLSGSSTQIGPTVGLSFIPPLNCVGAKVVNLPFVNSLAAGPNNGRVNVITKASSQIFVNGSATPLANPQSVTGITDWVTYSFTPTTNNVLLESDSVMNVALLTRDNVVGTMGYFSGFTLEPVVGLSTGVPGSIPCIPGNAAMTVFGFDTYQWFFEGEAIQGATQPTLIPSFAGSYVVEGIDIACGFRFPSNTFTFPFCPSTIGAAKNVQNVQETAPGSRIFDVSYRVFIQNFLPTIAANVQVIENLSIGLPLGASVELLGAPTLPFGILGGGVNPDFDGLNDTRLLPGNGTMPPASTAAIDFTVRVDMNNAIQDGFRNQVVVTTAETGPNDGATGPFNGQDFSHEGTNPDPNGNGEPNEEGENDPTLVCFFSNEFTYPAAVICSNVADSISVELDGIFSGVFTSSPAGLVMNPQNGNILPSESVPGVYEVVYTTTGRCPKVTSTEVTILGLPDTGGEPLQANICTGNEAIELGELLQGADLGGTWTDAEGNAIASSYTPTTAGTFIFNYVLDVPPCPVQTQEVVVEVFQTPTAGTPSDNVSFCVSEVSVDLFSLLSGATEGGTWTNENGVVVDAIYSIELPGSFTFTYEVSDDLCGTFTADVSFTVVAQPNAGVSLGSASFCAGETVSIDEFVIDGDEGGTWVNNQSEAIDPFEILLNAPGNFIFHYVVQAPPCPADSATVSITAIDGPSAGVADSPIRLCVTDPPINLIGLLEGADEGGVWTDNNGIEVPAIFVPEAFGTFTRTYTVTSEECENISTTLVIIVTETECLDPVLIIPQGFSPNGDGVGDQWIVQGLINYPNNQIKIFNRWGAEVFSARPYNNDWNGRNQGSDLPVGTYYYILDLGNGNDPRTGYVYLNR